MNDVPELGHELCASGRHSEVAEYPAQSHTQELIHRPQIKAEEESRRNHDDSRSNDFLAVRPSDFFHLTPGVGVKLLRVLRPFFN